MTAPGTYKCSCDICSEHLEYPVDWEGVKVECPHCGQGTMLRQPAATETQHSAAPAPPAMGSHGYASAMALDGSTTKAEQNDPLADAKPLDMMQSAEAVVNDEPDPFTCENCEAAMMPEEKVCIECGERRSTVSNWSGTAAFRLVAGIILTCELIVFGLQWTTTGEPFGLRKNTRHAIKVKLGLAEEVKPNLSAAQGGGNNNPATISPATKDPDLVLAKHELKPDKDNGALYIRGTVKNISQYRYLAVKVKFKLTDRAKSAIPGSTVSAYAQSIEPGKSWEFKVLLIDPDATGYEPILPIEGYR